MNPVNMLEAKTNLSRLVDAVESGAEQEIIIARNGKPAVRLVPLAPKKGGVKFGLAKGKFEVSDDINYMDDVVMALFDGDEAEADRLLTEKYGVEPGK